MTTFSSEFCFYSPDTLILIDHAISNNGDGYVSAYSKRTLDEIQKEYPGAIVCKWEEALEHQENGKKTPPKEITQEEWEYFLEVLPPIGWKGGRGRQSFKMSERLCGNITGIYVELNGRYFQMYDSIYLPHEEIIAKVQATL